MNKERRDVLIGAGALLASVGASQVLAAENASHAGHSAHGTARKAVGPATVVFDNAIALRAIGQACVAFCYENATNNPGLLECGKSATEMLAVNEAVEGLAALDSPRLGGVARAADAVYAYCEETCRKHEAHHDLCKRCADACANMRKAIAAL